MLIGRIKPILKESKISRLIQNLLKKYDDIVFKKSKDIGRILVIKYKINLIHPFFIIIKQKIFNPIMQRKIKEKVRKLFE